ncbi:cytidylyltransferase domain-containing protein [Halobacteriovorax sp. RT-1-4]|uniref:acylneuraminate cytidylyltransferase family protein n=1 Tax=unclassified Halobacteriovorax TaxID=2639665 RepID=UPI00399B37BB
MNIAFIPLRSGSKGIKNKNIKEINGKPLCYWTIKACQDSQVVDRIILAIDSFEYKEIIKSFNLSKVEFYQRSEKTNQDTSSTESVMLEYLEDNKTISNEDYFFLIQATSPLTTSKDIDIAYEQLIKSKKDSLLSCCEHKSFYWDKNGNPLNYNVSERPRRQEMTGTLQENGAIYISKVKDILTSKVRISGNIDVYIMPEYTSYEIDEEYDFIIIEELLKKYS